MRSDAFHDLQTREFLLHSACATVNASSFHPLQVQGMAVAAPVRRDHRFGLETISLSRNVHRIDHIGRVDHLLACDICQVQFR